MITAFTCGSHRARCVVPGCNVPTVMTCEFALGGRRTGQQCGHPVCPEHCRIIDGRRMCLAHQTLIERRLKG